VFVASGIRTFSRVRRIPVQAVDGVLEVVVLDVLDPLAEPDRLLGGPDAVRVEAEAVARERVREGPVALQLVLGWEDAALELVRGEPVALLERAGLGHELFDRADLPGAVLRVRVPEEEVRGERHPVTQAAAQELGHGHAPFLPQDVEARELQSGEDLRAVVIERRRRVGDDEAQLLDARGIAPEQIGLQALESGDGAFTASAHLPEPHVPVVGLDLDDGANETPPVAAVRVAERSVERNGDGRGPDVDDLHLS